VMENHSGREEIREARSTGLGRAGRRSATLGLEMEYLALPVERDGRVVGFVRTALSLDEVEAHLRSVRRIILLGALTMGFLTLVLGLYLVQEATRPFSLRTHVAETEAAEDRRRLALILASMTEGVVAVDEEQRIVHLNAAAGAIFHVEPGRAEGVPAWKLLRQPAVLEILDRAVRERRRGEAEVELPDEPRRLVEVRAAPLRDPEGEPGGAVLVVHDVTRLRHLSNGCARTSWPMSPTS